MFLILGGKVVAGLKWPLCKKAIPSSGFKEPDEGSKDADTVSASFEPSSGSLNPLEGVAFCRKVVSACLGQYCLRGLYEVGALLIQYLSHSTISAEELVKRILDTS